MRLLISNSNNPYYNLATEEYLLKNSSDDIVLLYRNQPCIVVGKHQNAMAEVNYRFVSENNIPVVRRISGGGTVYHDEGNVNFTFLQNGEEGNLINFRSFILPMAEFLKKYGISAEIGPRNDILINGLKVSGNAEHIYRKRTLHHGTLLFSSALSNLRNALYVEPGKYTDRAVKSVRSKVANIGESISANMDVKQFLNELSIYLLCFYAAEPINLSEEADSAISLAAVEKYTDWNWNYGYSPAYNFKHSFSLNSQNLTIEFSVEKGIIKESNIVGNLPECNFSVINSSLCGQRHSFKTISNNPEINKLRDMSGDRSPAFFWNFF